MDDGGGKRDIYAPPAGFGPQPASGAGRPEIRRRWAVVAGVGTEKARRDATALAQLLQSDYGFHVMSLLDGNATRAAILRSVSEEFDDANATTQWVFYFAGHGWKDGEKGYLIPSDGRTEDPKSCLAVDWLRERGISSHCAEILILLDACYAGQALIRAEDLDGLMSPDPGRKVRQILCAAGPKELAEDDSVFTRLLLEALEGRAGVHDEEGTIRFAPLKDYLVSGVKRRLSKNHSQTPIGGYFLGNEEQWDFELRPVVPRVPPETVKALKSALPSRRLEGLDILVKDCRNEPGILPLAVRLAKEHAHTGPGHDNDERVRAAKVLCQLAGLWGRSEERWPLPRKRVDGDLGEALRELAVIGSPPAVRDWARRGLRRTGRAARQAAAEWLLPKSRASTARPRDWAACVLLPEARRRLSWLMWWRIPLSWLRLWIAARVWALVETKTRRRRLKGTTALLAVLFSGLESSYYLSIRNQSAIVVRSGHPGFKVVPWVGRVLVTTGYSAQDLKDPALAREERLKGFWPLLRDGAWPWGPQLFAQLGPAAGGLAEWRMGDEQRAFSRFQEGIEAGDSEVVPLLGYLALQSVSAASPAVDLLVQALQGDEKLHEPALAALAVVRDTRPAGAQAMLVALAQRLPGAAGAEAVALIEAVEVLNDPQRPGGSPVPAALLQLLRAHPEDSSLRLRVARALKSLVGRDPAYLASVLPAVRESILHGPKDEQGTWLSILDSPAPLPPPVERSIVDVLADALAAETDAAKQAGLLKALGSRLARSPSLAVSYLPVLTAHLGAREPGLRLTAARALASLPAGMAPGEAVVGALADLILSGERLELRTEAVEILGDLKAPGSQQAAVGALIAAAAEGNSLVREVAAIRMVDKGLASGESARQILPVLRSLLADPVPSIRQAAAQGVLLLSASSGEDDAVAFGEVARALTSDDPREARSTRGSLLEWLPQASPQTRRRLLRQFAAHAGTLNVFTADPVFDLLREEGQADLLPDLALAFASLLGAPGADEDVQDLARIRLWELGRRSEVQAAPALAALFESLDAPGERDRAAAAEAVGYVAAGQPRLATEATRKLAPLLADPSAEVQARTAAALGAIGSRQAQAARGLLDPLLTGLGSRSPAVRTACAKALGNLDLEPSLAGRVTPVLLVAVQDADPAVRREAASALLHWGQRAWRKMGSALPRLREQLKRERDPEVLHRLRSALAVLGGGDPEIARQVIGLSESWIASTGREKRLAAVWLLRRLGETHPETGGRVVAALRPLLRDADEGIRRDVLMVLYLIGAADVDNAALAMDAVCPLLLDPEWPGRWNAIANHLEPLVREHPVLAPRAVHWLRELLASGTLGAEERLLGPQVVETLIEAVTLQARFDWEAPWPLLVSASSFERQVGQEVLARIVAEQPERAPETLERLARYRRSLRPDVRLSAAQAVEMVTLLQRTREVAGKPAARRWREVLESLPPMADVRAAVRLALDRLEPGVQHG